MNLSGTPTEMDLSGVLTRLRLELLARLPHRLGELHRALHRAQRHPAHVHHAHKLAHNLQGTVGSYGFPELAEILIELERMLDPTRARSDDDWTAIRQQFERAQQVTEQLRQE